MRTVANHTNPLETIAFLHLRLIWTSVCSDDVDNALMCYSCEGLA